MVHSQRQQYLIEQSEYSGSPVIDAIRNALSRFGISLEGAEHIPGPHIFPPIYAVTYALLWLWIRYVN